MTQRKISHILTDFGANSVTVVVRRKTWHDDQLNIYHFKYKIDAVEKVLRELNEELSDFARRMCDIDEKYLFGRRSRRYVHTERERLFGEERKDLGDKHARQVAGLWLNTDLNHSQMWCVIKEACEAAEVKHDSLRSFIQSFKW